MSELTDRLNAVESSRSDGEIHRDTTCWYRNPDGPEAAAYIERLEAENERLVEALNAAVVLMCRAVNEYPIASGLHVVDGADGYGPLRDMRLNLQAIDRCGKERDGSTPKLTISAEPDTSTDEVKPLKMGKAE